MKKLIVSGGLIALVLLFCGVAASATIVATPALPAISGLHSPSHPDPTHWYADRQVSFAWTPAVGVAGYSYVLDQNPATVPDTTIDLAAVSFAAKTDYATGAGPHGVAVGDFNRDGKLDLAVADYGSNTVSVLLGNGGRLRRQDRLRHRQHSLVGRRGRLQQGRRARPRRRPTGAATPSACCSATAPAASAPRPTTRPASSPPRSPWATSTRTARLTWRWPTTAATSSALCSATAPAALAPWPTPMRPAPSPARSPWATSTSDGVPDLAVANRGDNTVSVLLVHAIFGFAGRTDYATGSRPFSVAVGDFNRDGVPDLAVADSSADTVSVLLDDGTGGFGAKTDYATGATPYSVAVGDFNGDGMPDLAVANASSNTVSVLLGDGTGGFGAKTDYRHRCQPALGRRGRLQLRRQGRPGGGQLQRQHGQRAAQHDVGGRGQRDGHCRRGLVLPPAHCRWPRERRSHGHPGGQDRRHPADHYRQRSRRLGQPRRHCHPDGRRRHRLGRREHPVQARLCCQLEHLLRPAPGQRRRRAHPELPLYRQRRQH